MPTSVALGPHFEEFLKKQIASGRYNNISEVVRAGLRLLEDQHKENALKLSGLRAAIKAGLDGGVGGTAEEVFDRLESKYRALASKERAQCASSLPGSRQTTSRILATTLRGTMPHEP